MFLSMFSKYQRAKLCEGIYIDNAALELCLSVPRILCITCEHDLLNLKFQFIKLGTLIICNERMNCIVFKCQNHKMRKKTL